MLTWVERNCWCPSSFLAELYYVNEKHGRPIDFRNEYRKLRQAPQCQLVSLEPESVIEFDELRAIPEMHDRIIAGVARRYGLPLLTKDETIRSSGLVEVIW